MNSESLETCSQALNLEPDNEAVKELYEECKNEWDDDNVVDEENVEKKRFNKLENWLKEGGSKYDKLKIRFYNPIYRGVHAAKRIKVIFMAILELDLYTFLDKFENFRSYFILIGRRRDTASTQRTDYNARDGGGEPDWC